MSKKEQTARLKRLRGSQPLQPYSSEWLIREGEPDDMSPESRAMIERMVAALG